MSFYGTSSPAAGAGGGGGGITQLTGDVSASGSGSVPATVNSVGGASAAAVSSATTTSNTATSTNTASAVVQRDGSGNFAASTITANLTGNASGSSASFSGSLAGDVTGPQGTTVVASVGGSTATAVGAATVLANASTSANTASAIVRRSSGGGFSAGTVLFGDGTVSLPSIALTSNTDDGFYWNGSAGTTSFAMGGIEAIRFRSGTPDIFFAAAVNFNGGSTFSNQLVVPAGTLGTPGLGLGSGTSGLYASSAGVIDLTNGYRFSTSGLKLLDPAAKIFLGSNLAEADTPRVECVGNDYRLYLTAPNATNGIVVLQAGTHTVLSVTQTAVNLNGAVTLFDSYATPNLLWDTDGGANIGATASGRPDKIFAKSGVHIGGNDTKSILEATSTTLGFLPPRMTTTQKNAITSPTEGLMVYDITLHKLSVFTGTVWETVTSL